MVKELLSNHCRAWESNLDQIHPDGFHAMGSKGCQHLQSIKNASSLSSYKFLYHTFVGARSVDQPERLVRNVEVVVMRI